MWRFSAAASFLEKLKYSTEEGYHLQDLEELIWLRCVAFLLTMNEINGNTCEERDRQLGKIITFLLKIAFALLYLSS